MRLQPGLRTLSPELGSSISVDDGPEVLQSEELGGLDQPFDCDSWCRSGRQNFLGKGRGHDWCREGGAAPGSPPVEVASLSIAARGRRWHWGVVEVAYDLNTLGAGVDPFAVVGEPCWRASIEGADGVDVVESGRPRDPAIGIVACGRDDDHVTLFSVLVAEFFDGLVLKGDGSVDGSLGAQWRVVVFCVATEAEVDNDGNVMEPAQITRRVRLVENGGRVATESNENLVDCEPNVEVVHVPCAGHCSMGHNGGIGRYAVDETGDKCSMSAVGA